MYFINRENELRTLETLSKKSGFKSLLLYGRRRIGKTYLLKKFILDKDGIYILSQKRNIRENLDMIGKVFEENSIPDVKAVNFIELFKKTKNYLENKIIIIDEFQYLIENDKNILSDFQYIFDEILSGMDILIIFSGSSIGMIEKVGTDLSSPLYGRFTSRMKLNRMSFRSIINFHPGKTIDELIKIYSAMGGVPHYHIYYDNNYNFDKNILSTFFDSHHPLYSEAEFLLRQELRDISTYMGILNAIANGKNKLTEIANMIYFPAKDLSKYLSVLLSLDLVKKITPINSKINSKLSRYQISDNYYQFWFRYVASNRSKIELFNTDEAIFFMNNDLSTYIGYIVENILIDLFQEKYTRVGKWWYKNNEIDLIAVDEVKKEVVFVEIKWQNKKIDTRIINHLIETSKLVPGFDNYKKRYIVISKNGFKSENNDKSSFWDTTDIIEQFNILL